MIYIAYLSWRLPVNLRENFCGNPKALQTWISVRFLLFDTNPTISVVCIEQYIYIVVYIDLLNKRFLTLLILTDKTLENKPTEDFVCQRCTNLPKLVISRYWVGQEGFGDLEYLLLKEKGFPHSLPKECLKFKRRKNKRHLYQWKALSKQQQINNDFWNLSGLQSLGDGKLF